MKNDPRLKIRAKSLCRMLAGVAMMTSLAACESPLGSRISSVDEERYTQSLVSRANLEVARARRTNPTLDLGVREYARVDSPGPGNVQIAAAMPAIAGTAPATALSQTGDLALRGPYDPKTMTKNGVIGSLDAADLVGRANAQLNRPEVPKDLTLQQAILRTMQHSLAVKVESYTPGIREAQVIEAESALDAVLFGTSQWNVTDQPPLQENNPSFSNGQTWQNQIGIKRILPTGTQVQSTLNLNYRDINTAGFANSAVQGLGNRKTSWTANIGVQVIQPLLRGYGTDVTLANIYLAQRDYRISESEFRRVVMNNAADVEEAYFNLVLASVNVDVLKRLVVASQQTFDNVWERREIDANKTSLSQAAQALARRTADLALAQETQRTASDRLKTLMNDPEFDINSDVLIRAVDSPITDPVRYDLENCMDLALQQRPEIVQARLQLERSDIVVKVARNGLLPQLDLILSAQSNAISNTSGGALGATVDSANRLDFGAGIRFEIPIGNRERESQFRRRVIERRQVIENLMLTAQRAIEEVHAQYRRVLVAYEDIQRRDAVRVFASHEFSSILEIQDIRTRTPEFLQLKLDSQARLAQAEQDVIQSMVSYNLAIMRLEKAMGTLLEFDRISLDRPPVPKEEGADFLRLLGNTWFKNK